MISVNETKFTKDPSGNKLIVTRDFNAPLEKVWKAWTDRDQLDIWWAPKPWKANTMSMDFKDGGQWLYVMAGPAGEEHWCKVDFQTIEPQKNFTTRSSFCDKNGNTNADMPTMHWFIRFTSTGAGTAITVEIIFDSKADLEKIVEMGFKQGFTMGLGNLDELLVH